MIETAGILILGWFYRAVFKLVQEQRESSKEQRESSAYVISLKNQALEQKNRELEQRDRIIKGLQTTLTETEVKVRDLFKAFGSQPIKALPAPADPKVVKKKDKKKVDCKKEPEQLKLL